MSDTNRLPKGDIFNYAFYMFAEAFIIYMPLMFMNIFFTKNLLISGAVLGTVLSIGRIIDTVVGLLSGGVIQHSREKGVLYSKWITATRWIIGLGVIFMFANTSALPLAMKLVVVFLAYLMVNACMNFVQTSQFNVLAVMGGASLDNRNKLAFRGTQGTTIAMLIVGTLTPILLQHVFTPLVGDNYSYLFVAIIYAVPYLIGCHTLSKAAKKYEQSAPVNTGPAIKVGDMVKSVFTNSQLLILLLTLSIAYSGQFTIMNFAVHYFLYVLPPFEFIGKVFSGYDLMSIATPAGMVAGILGSFIGPIIGVKLGKKRAMVTGFILQTIALVLVYFYARTLVPYILLYGLFTIFMYIYMAFNANYVIDCGEYHFCKTGQDNRAVAMGMMTLPVKIGLLVGGAVPLFALDLIGWKPEAVEQVAGFADNFMLVFAMFPAAFCLLGAIVMGLFYKISDADAAKYAKENAERAAAAKK